MVRGLVYPDAGTSTLTADEAYAFEIFRLLKTARELLTDVRLELKPYGWPETVDGLHFVGAKLRVLEAMLREVLSDGTP